MRKFPYHLLFLSKTAYAYIDEKRLVLAYFSTHKKKICWDENSIFQWQLSRTGFAYPDQMEILVWKSIGWV